MASVKANYLREALINAVLRGVTFPVISTVYIGLYSTIPTASDGSDGVEQTYAGYARVAVPCSTSNWKDPASATEGQTNNSFKIVFPVVRAAGSNSVGFFVSDSPSGGNTLWWGSMTSLSTNQGDQPLFDTSQLVIAET